MNAEGRYEAEALKAVEALKENRFLARYFPTADEAARELLAAIPREATVGIAGSWTLMQLDIAAKLEERGNTVFCHHKPGLTPEEVMATRRAQLTCDVFLTGTNAITADGRLVNMDATGNRVAAMMFGPKKAFVLTGANKIVPGIHEAMERIRTTAAPQNNRRLNRPNPCVQSGQCMDCQGPTRLCNITTVLHKKPPASTIHVWIIGEELGY